ncbi:hypothetical protein N9L13_05230, partial [Flavobacteriales bacterium]|nr:hypothetical protein [Flavobacteriales bacterium]
MKGSKTSPAAILVQLVLFLFPNTPTILAVYVSNQAVLIDSFFRLHKKYTTHRCHNFNWSIVCLNMTKYLLSIIGFFFGSVVCQAQGSIAQLTSENMAFFTISIDGVRLASDASIMQEITGLKEGGQYNVFIDYVSPEFSDVRTMLRLNANGGRGA